MPRTAVPHGQGHALGSTPRWALGWSLFRALLALLLIIPGGANAQATLPSSAGASANLAALAAAGTTPEPGGQTSAPTTDNPYGLAALWAGSDAVARSVLLLLLLMSLGSWYILTVKLLDQVRMGRQAREVERQFWSADSVEQGLQSLSADSPYRYVAEAAQNALVRHPGLRAHVALADWLETALERAVERIQGRTQRGLAFLATVGSIAPFVGLFGTVWGIYHALTAIGVSGQASLDRVAGPVGEALLMTAIGLAVAVPAVLAYNWLVRRNKAVMDDVRAFAHDLHAVMLGSLNPPQR
ncbi:MAG: MotA/TolQ/ExbB proton channel family protein [Rhodoferax sp.]